jgi:uncharacterized membrane protein YdjX (TVP38/TMEM64 family)
VRIFEKYTVEKFVSPQTIKKFDYLIGHEGVIVSFLLFLIPGFPKDALFYLLGLTLMHTVFSYSSPLLGGCLGY